MAARSGASRRSRRIYLIRPAGLGLSVHRHKKQQWMLLLSWQGRKTPLLQQPQMTQAWTVLQAVQLLQTILTVTYVCQSLLQRLQLRTVVQAVAVLLCC